MAADQSKTVVGAEASTSKPSTFTSTSGASILWTRTYPARSRTTKAALARAAAAATAVAHRRIESALAKKTLETRTGVSAEVPRTFPPVAASKKRCRTQRSFFDEAAIEDGIANNKSKRGTKRKLSEETEPDSRKRAKVAERSRTAPSVSPTPTLESEPGASSGRPWACLPPLSLTQDDTIPAQPIKDEAVLVSALEEPNNDSDSETSYSEEENDANQKEDAKAQKKSKARKTRPFRKGSSSVEQSESAKKWIFDRISDWNLDEPLQWHAVRVTTSNSILGSTGLADVVFVEAASKPEKTVLVSQIVTTEQKWAMTTTPGRCYPTLPLSFLALSSNTTPTYAV